MNQNNSSNTSLTDLHTHILPSVDDGAADIETAIEILTKQKKMGVDRIVLTPHYYPLREELDSFLARREQAYTQLCAAWDEASMPRLKLGVEVRYTPQLSQMDMHQLTIENSNYLLLELPDSGVAPYLKQVVYDIQTQGIVPILAHVERCSLFRHEPNQLLELVEMGVLAQIDVAALSRRRSDSFTTMCINNGLAHIVASDIHNLTDRALGIGSIKTEQYLEILAWTEEFARAVWDCTPLPAFSVCPIKKGLFRYR